MTDSDEKLAALDKTLLDLPKQAQPQNDLWPGIESKIDAADRRSPVRNWALAATLLAAIGLVSISVQQLSPDAENFANTPAPSVTTDITASPLRPVAELVSFPGADYGVMRDEQLAELDKRLEKLPEGQRELINDNLAVIRQAIVELDKALGENPDSSLLNDMLLSTYQRELATINRINRLTATLREDL